MVQENVRTSAVAKSSYRALWMLIQTNYTLERLNREIKRRTKVVGTFPDGQSALMLVCARLRHVASHEWGSKRYLNMQHLHSMVLSEESINAG